jgi:hypothetical protein
MRKQTNTFLDHNPTSYDLKVVGRKQRTDTGDLGSGVNWVGKKVTFEPWIFWNKNDVDLRGRSCTTTTYEWKPCALSWATKDRALSLSIMSAEGRHELLPSVVRLSAPLPPMPIHSSCPQERSLNQGPDLHGRGVCGINSRFLSVARLYRQELKEIRSTKLKHGLWTWQAQMATGRLAIGYETTMHTSRRRDHRSDDSFLSGLVS